MCLYSNKNLFTEIDSWPDLAYRPLSTPVFSSEHDSFLTSKVFVMKIHDVIYVRWHVVNATNVSVNNNNRNSIFIK